MKDNIDLWYLECNSYYSSIFLKVLIYILYIAHNHNEFY